MMFKSAWTVSWEKFFIPFLSTVLSNKSWRTSRLITLLLSLVSLSTYAIHQITFLYIASAFIRLISRMVRKNFVFKVSECKNCLAFDTDRLLVLTKLRTDPKAAPHCVYKLCIFWRSIFERNPVPVSLTQNHFDSEPELGIYPQRQFD